MSEQIEGRNAVLEAFRSGKCVDKLFVLDRCQDGPVRTIVREARKKDTIINFVPKERLDQLSETGAHQGVCIKKCFQNDSSCKKYGNGQLRCAAFFFALYGCF